MPSHSVMYVAKIFVVWAMSNHGSCGYIVCSYDNYGHAICLVMIIVGMYNGSSCRCLLGGR